MSPEFPKLGVLIGLLALRIGDYVQEIGPQAMESLSFLYTLVRCQKGKQRPSKTSFHPNTNSKQVMNPLHSGAFLES